MRCPACGRNVPESGRYCAECGARVDASQPTRTTAEHESLQASSGAIDGSQFIAGTLLAGRYRIVGLLGRGGMGEVYRAEDLKLGQPVALKFLPIQLGQHADRLARFHQEVRLARQVSHPNVCRVYDIGESNGQHFLSMEYVGGEDLASLLRRIGRLPTDKALELARQLCAGLAAAHDRKVLHRDLKPANVLIDERGRVRIADFGLAHLVDEQHQGKEIAGTVGYMAPEQLRGEGFTTRSDVYALGLVLYEMFTGKRALEVQRGAVDHQAGRETRPSNPSVHVPDLDAAVERVILRCLEADPARRPPSVWAVAAALPGANALAAAIAAGETPSPDMVAAAGEPGILSPSVGVLCFGGVLVGLILLAVFMGDVNLIGLSKIDRSSQFLTERAHSAVRNLGYPEPPADEAIGYTTDIDYLQYIDERDRSPTRWRTLANSQPPALLFWYRRSLRPLVPIGGTDIVTRQNPPDTRAGMVSIMLDRTGRLTRLVAVPAQIENSQGPDHQAATAIDWTSLFAEAGLSMAQFSPATSQWLPPIFADTRAAWAGTYPDRPDVPIRIEAAATHGKPVYFEIVAPWTQARNVEAAPVNTSGERVGVLMRTLLGPLVLIGGIALAVRNLHLRRGDRRGAMRLMVFIIVSGSVSNVLETGNLQILTRGPSLIGFVAVFVWLLYIALEPHARRIWPELMIGWSRLLSGNVRDPLVGRDVLVGVLVAIANGLVLALHTRVRGWIGRPVQFPIGATSNPWDGIEASSDLLLGGRYALSRIIGTVMSIPTWGETMLTFFVLLVLVALLRRRSLAMLATVLIVTVIYLKTRGGWLLASPPADHFAPAPVDVAFFAAVQAAVIFVAVRFGVLTMVVAAFVSLLLTLVPVTFDSSVPYASSSRLVAATVIALAAYGWHTALAGRPMFGGAFVGSESRLQG
jgi:eukaryotic-like serine/threonine-protein kinase